MKNALQLPVRRGSAASLALLSAFAAASASAQITWSGATDNDWLTGSNWSGGNAPDTNAEIARFDTSSASSSPTLSGPVTIGKLEFLSGAGAYAIGGETLTIDTTVTAGDSILHSAGNTQTISANLTLTGSRNLNVASGSTLTLAGTLGAGGNNNIGVTGGGVVNIGAVASGNLNQLQQNGATTVNLNAAVPTGSYFSFDNAGRINFNASTNRGGGTGASSSGSGRIYITADGVSLSGTGSFQSLRFRGGNGSDNTIGADIAGGGTASIAELRVDAARTNAIYRVHSSADNILNVSNITGTVGAGTYFNVQGGGIVRLVGSTAITAITPIVVDGATLELNKTVGTDAISSGSSVTVNAGGTVRLLASDQFNAAANLVLNGGALDLDGFSEGLGTLDLDAASSLDLGAAGGNSVSFANSSALAWDSFTLSIAGTFVSGSSVRFGTDATGLGSGQLANISIAGFNNVGIDGSGWLTATAIPEPSAAAALAGLGILGFAAARRRRAAA